MRLRVFVLLVVFFLLISSCSKEKNIKFNSHKWKTEQDLEDYPYRELMIKDISDNKLFLGFNYQRLVDSLGVPGNVQPRNNNELYYLINDDYGWDIDPVDTKYLIFVLDKDSIVVNIKVREWKKR